MKEFQLAERIVCVLGVSRKPAWEMEVLLGYPPSKTLLDALAGALRDGRIVKDLCLSTWDDLYMVANS